jgi:hypothetical protein
MFKHLGSFRVGHIAGAITIGPMRIQQVKRLRTAEVILKGIAIWILETSCEAFLLGLLLLIISWVQFHRTTSGATRLIHDLLVFTAAVALMFFLTGYLLTTAILRAVWRGKELWSYSLVAIGLFLIHFEVLNRGVGGAFDPSERTIVRVVGACIAFACTLGGSWLLSKSHVWSRNREKSE